mmetsp:Transcript_25295/g.58805  ORF Transcript_25295/g.58805 Transcript_25295/m.58805 type:complete len:204 (+) Transcript_25295:202-813(+)
MGVDGCRSEMCSCVCLVSVLGDAERSRIHAARHPVHKRDMPHCNVWQWQTRNHSSSFCFSYKSIGSSEQLFWRFGQGGPWLSWTPHDVLLCGGEDDDGDNHGCEQEFLIHECHLYCWMYSRKKNGGCYGQNQKILYDLSSLPWIWPAFLLRSSWIDTPRQCRRQETFLYQNNQIEKAFRGTRWRTEIERCARVVADRKPMAAK